MQLPLLSTLSGGGVQSQGKISARTEKSHDVVDRLWNLMDQNSASLERFAAKCGIAADNLRSVLKKGVRPSVALLQAVCRAYKVSPAWLLLGEGEMERQPAKSVPSDSAEVARLVQIIVSQAEEIKELRAASLRPQAPTPDMEALLIRQAERSTAAPAPAPPRPAPSPGTAKTRR